MTLLFKKEDITALDFVLKNLAEGNTPVTSDVLIPKGYLKGKNRKNDFNYLAEILYSYGCCEINKKYSNNWGLLGGDNTYNVYNNGGFENIFNTKIKEQSETKEKTIQEYTKLTLEIQDLKNRLKDYPRTRKHAIIALCVSVIGGIMAVVSFILNLL